MKQQGQATVEYIFVLALLGYLGVTFVTGINGQFSKLAGHLGVNLTESLKVGVCETECFYNGFTNQRKAINP